MTERGKGNIPAGGRTGARRSFGQDMARFDLPGEIFRRAEKKEEEPYYYYEVEFETNTEYESEIGSVYDPTEQGVSTAGYEDFYYGTKTLECFSISSLEYTVGKYSSGSPTIDVTTEDVYVLKDSPQSTSLTICDENGNSSVIEVYESDQFEQKTVVTGVTITAGSYLAADEQNGTIEIMNVAAGQAGPAGSVVVSGDDTHLFKSPDSACSDITVLTQGNSEEHDGTLLSASGSPTYSLLYIDDGETPEYTVLVTQEDPCDSSSTATKAVLVPVDSGEDPCAPAWSTFDYLEKGEVSSAGLTPKGNPVPVTSDPLKLRIPLLEDQW